MYGLGFFKFFFVRMFHYFLIKITMQVINILVWSYYLIKAQYFIYDEKYVSINLFIMWYILQLIV